MMRHRGTEAGVSKPRRPRQGCVVINEDLVLRSYLPFLAAGPKGPLSSTKTTAHNSRAGGAATRARLCSLWLNPSFPPRTKARTHVARARLEPLSSPAISRARTNTASNISGVNRPVNVFCWLGWNDATRCGAPKDRVLHAMPEPRLRPRREPAAGARRGGSRRTRSGRARRSRAGGTSATASRRGTWRSGRVRAASACSPAARAREVRHRRVDQAKSVVAVG